MSAPPEEIRNAAARACRKWQAANKHRPYWMWVGPAMFLAEDGTTVLTEPTDHSLENARELGELLNWRDFTEALREAKRRRS